MRSIALPIALVGTLLWLPAAAQTANPASECGALQAEVESLRARLQRYESTSSVPGAAPQASAAGAGALAAAAPNAGKRTTFDTTLPGTAPKPQPRQVVTMEEPYSNTGCRQGFLTAMKPAIWQNKDRWLDLERGMSPAEVEAILGVEHYDGHDGPNVVWGYGKCKAAYKAKVMFVDGKLAEWNAPR